MAEAVLEVVLDNLSSLIQRELGLFLGVNQEMKRLESILTTVKAVLQDAEHKQLTESDEALKNWLSKLKDAAHMLDDILDRCSTETLSLENQALTCRSALKVRGSCFSSIHPKHALFRHKIARKLKDMSERLDEIAEERSKFHLRVIVTERRRIEVPEWRQTASTITESHVYGRDDDKKRIVDFLVGDASNLEDLCVYPIIGIGGLGKTTLAQLVFNDERVVDHFEQRIWVCVSEDFSLKRLVKAIIESASGHACEDLDLDLLQRRLQELLQRKRYLLVLDDVWNENQDKWDKLKHVLACGSKGASVLVTTRLGKVASIMGTISPHELSMLSEEDCWELFKQRAFAGNKGESAELVAIGKEIVKKCKGVPLAAKALGSLLQFKSEERDWVHVKESEIWNLPEDEYSILPALRLSYLDLTPKLRQCFAYCALLPKDTLMRKMEVIELWMANGFISSKGSLEVEDDGDRVWNELYLKSFFQDVTNSADVQDDYDVTFKMHDLVHDLAQSVMKEECYCFPKESCASNLPRKIRHVSFGHDVARDEWSSLLLHHANSLKALVVHDEYQRALPRVDTVMKCFSLRLLDMMLMDAVSSSIGHLKLLRRLNLSHGHFKTLPDSICELWNLQILNLNDCSRLRKLPNRMRCLKSLRHLHLTRCSTLSSLAPNMGQLTSLKTLSDYIVGKQKGFLLAELGPMKLKGYLRIRNLERVTSVMDAKEANMADKHLNFLVLSWDNDEDSQSQENAEQILEVLQPNPQQLRTLTVHGYMGAQLPTELSNLNALEILKIKRCNNLETITEQVLQGLHSLKKLELAHLQMFNFSASFRFLTSLEDLTIARCPEVKDIPEALQNLVNLQSLTLFDLRNLASLPHWLGNLTSLKNLSIYDCPMLLSLPMSIQCLGSLETLSISYCPELKKRCEKETGADWHKIAHVPHLYL